MSNQKQIIENFKKEGTTMNKYFPKTQDALSTNQYFVAVATEEGYTLARLTKDQFPTDLAQRSACAGMNLQEYVDYVCKHFVAYAKAGKFINAWDTIQATVRAYNEEVIPQYANDGIVRTSAKAADKAAYAIRQNLERQRSELHAEAQRLCGIKRVTKALEVQRELYLASARLYDLDDLFTEDPTIKFKEITNVPMLGKATVDYDNVDEGYDPIINYTYNEKASEPEEVKYAIRASIPASRYQVLDVSKLKEDITILNVLIFKAYSNEEFSFRAKDAMGRRIEYDNTPAPTTEKEYREWELKQEFRTFTKPINEFGYNEDSDII